MSDSLRGTVEYSVAKWHPGQARFCGIESRVMLGYRESKMPTLTEGMRIDDTLGGRGGEVSVDLTSKDTEPYVEPGSLLTTSLDKTSGHPGCHESSSKESMNKYLFLKQHQVDGELYSTEAEVIQEAKQSIFANDDLEKHYIFKLIKIVTAKPV